MTFSRVCLTPPPPGASDHWQEPKIRGRHDPGGRDHSDHQCFLPGCFWKSELVPWQSLRFLRIVAQLSSVYFPAAAVQLHQTSCYAADDGLPHPGRAQGRHLLRQRLAGVRRVQQQSRRGSSVHKQGIRVSGFLLRSSKCHICVQLKMYEVIGSLSGSLQVGLLLLRRSLL